MTVGVRSGVRDVGMKETEWSGEGSADGFRVGAECFDMVASGVVGGNELFETGNPSLSSSRLTSPTSTLPTRISPYVTTTLNSTKL